MNLSRTNDAAKQAVKKYSIIFDLISMSLMELYVIANKSKWAMQAISNKHEYVDCQIFFY